MPRRSPDRGPTPSTPPPHDLDLERGLLGLVFLYPELVERLVEVVDCFYSPAHGIVAQAMLRLQEEGQHIDPVTVANHLRQHNLIENVGGAASLVTMQSAAPMRSATNTYVKEILELKRRRSLKGGLAEAGAKLDAGDVPGALEQLRTAIEDPALLNGSRFHRWTVAELLEEDRSFEWTLRGFLVRPTYGMIGGEQKTLKSYLSMFLDLAIATGEPMFGRFKVDNPGPVVAFVGEGGRRPYARRLERIARAMGVDHPADVDLHPRFDVAPVDSAEFRLNLRRELDILKPALVHIDPWYAFHGTSAEGSNLHAEGALLSGLSVPCSDAGSSLLINHHFSKTGTQKGLGRFSLAGAQEWVDSWVLLSHRTEPDVEGGRFWLKMEVGSRQWGGSVWDLDLSLGRFDPEMGEYDGEITWDIHRHSATGAMAEGHVGADESRIIAAVAQYPGELNRESLAKVAPNLPRGRKLVDQLEKRGLIERKLAPPPGGGRKAWLYFPAVIKPKLTLVSNAPEQLGHDDAKQEEHHGGDDD